jgi:hypothetical protein
MNLCFDPALAHIIQDGDRGDPARHHHDRRGRGWRRVNGYSSLNVASAGSYVVDVRVDLRFTKSP